jgi:predicted nucleic acid-binding protein
LIERVAPAILIPNAVIDEVRAGQEKDRTATTALEWAERYRVEDMAVAATIEHWDIGLGESQVIARCLGRSRWAVLDDRAARSMTSSWIAPWRGSENENAWGAK